MTLRGHSGDLLKRLHNSIQFVKYGYVCLYVLMATDAVSRGRIPASQVQSLREEGKFALHCKFCSHYRVTTPA